MTQKCTIISTDLQNQWKCQLLSMQQICYLVSQFGFQKSKHFNWLQWTVTPMYVTNCYFQAELWKLFIYASKADIKNTIKPTPKFHYGFIFINIWLLFWIINDFLSCFVWDIIWNYSYFPQCKFTLNFLQVYHCFTQEPTNSLPGDYSSVASLTDN